MSTFNGLVREFPDIRIDYFRHHDGLSPPLACFLSHVHSDHLSGLETLRSPFVYCSAATREILLRLERYPCRINYSKGILEARQQTYKHLSKVIVFIEGHGKAILYTGDVRCEPWFVNTIAQSPTLIEYTCGIKTLDTIYLDTSFTDDIPFQTKAEGIAELLRKVARYPKDTIFYIQSWTYGYEDVWIALSKALNSPIHVDDYKLRIFSSIAPALSGFMCGNSLQTGCLTANKNVRLHSCESGNMCSIARQSSVVRIQPVIASFSDGKVIHEAGIGGGGEDLEREMELGVASTSDLHNLLEIIDALKNTTEEARTECTRLLTNALASGRNLQLNIREDIYLTDLRKAILSIAKQHLKAASSLTGNEDHGGDELPKVIRFPYSRHSSYPELCNLLNAFKPKDIWPCTFHLDSWREKAISIESLFGRYCSGNIFAHDIKVNDLTKQNIQTTADEPDTQRHESCSPSVSSPTGQASPRTSHTFRPKDVNRITERDSISLQRESGRSCNYKQRNTNAEKPVEPFEEQVDGASLLIREWLSQCHTGDENDSQNTATSLTPILSIRHSPARLDAYKRMLQNCRGTEWNSIELISTGCNHSAIEQEL
ncbi:hypothetical protein M441DRAFT_70873 [Trichoderma asperellum CBS 433.97]|uniref:DNA repair metallo-beta-lactamase domain-containing protein n=1 Tax=Trichoderma asperellum (strain ATCC 204424 / CBS 433.97 / NBRC 101777) TaxID=1042311 RepID=A0A2T3Z114_TRIA4|nr:hypothetical protein M441DRAFT_70873 [Trichoderma asperellum CBS 433.97]PTB38498.1 hypothetical protein M441DRAFT_70873 [Trichoderma asperellum CBS 433.97]